MITRRSIIAAPFVIIPGNALAQRRIGKSLFQFNGGGVADTAQATAFDARAVATFPSIDTTHRNAYKTLINSIVNSDSGVLWGKLDILYIFAAQDASLAVLNLVSTSFTGVVNGGPTFTVNNGYTGTDASTTIYIDTTFNVTAGGIQYTQDSAHQAIWSNSSFQASASGGWACGFLNGAAGGLYAGVLPWTSGNTFDTAIHTGNAGGGTSVANTNSLGHFVGSRTAPSGAGAFTAYQSGSSVGSTADADVALQSFNIYVLAANNITPVNGNGNQISSFHCGAGLTSANVTTLYNALHAYLVTIAGIGY